VAKVIPHQITVLHPTSTPTVLAESTDSPAQLGAEVGRMPALWHESTFTTDC